MKTLSLHLLQMQTSRSLRNDAQLSLSRTWRDAAADAAVGAEAERALQPPGQDAQQQAGQAAHALPAGNTVPLRARGGGAELDLLLRRQRPEAQDPPEAAARAHLQVESGDL